MSVLSRDPSPDDPATGGALEDYLSSFTEEVDARHVARYSAWRRLGLHRLPKLSLFGLFLILLLVLVSAWPTLFTSQDPNLQNVLGALAKPSRAHLLGTDTLGRDLYTRLIYGTRTSLLLAVWATAMGMAVGVPIGIIAGVLGGVVEKVVMRIVDVFLAFPQDHPRSVDRRHLGGPLLEPDDSDRTRGGPWHGSNRARTSTRP